MKLSTIMKKGLAVGMMGIMVVSLAACGGGKEEAKTDAKTEAKADEGGSDAKSDVTLKFQQWWGAELPDGYLDDICAKYEEETGVKVELLTAPGPTPRQRLQQAQRTAPSQILSV